MNGQTVTAEASCLTPVYTYYSLVVFSLAYAIGISIVGDASIFYVIYFLAVGVAV